MRRKTYKTYYFFFHETTSMQSDTTVVSIAAVFFNTCSYYNSYTWSKNTELTVKKS